MNKTISIQEFLSPALPQVIGCKDYADEERLLKRVDRILTISGVETLFLHLSMEEFEANANKMDQLLQTLTDAVGDEERARMIGLENELDRAVIWEDST